MVGKTDIPARGNHFFPPFSETRVSLFPSSRKVFFNEILHSGWWKRIFWLVENVFVCSEFFLKAATKINESQFFKKDHF